MADRTISIQVFNSSLDKVTEIDEFESVSFARSFYEHGMFTIKIDAGNERALELKKNRIIMLGNFTNKCGIIKYTKFITDENGTSLEVKGYEMKGLLSQRYTIPNTGESHQSFTSENAETVIKNIVQRNCTDLTNYAFPNFKIAINQNRGNVIDFKTRYKKLSSEISSLAKENELGYIVNLDLTNKKRIFEVVEGVNRVEGQSVNSRAIFSIAFDNVEREEYVSNSINCYDSAIIAGQGEGATREIETINTNTGDEMHVTFIDARDTTGTSALLSRGNSKLAGLKQVEAFENMLYHDRTMVYEQDWDLGDYVSLRSQAVNITVDKQIIELTEFYTNEGFDLSVVFGEKLQTINDVINTKTDRGVE
jgi:hypothetical protein